MTSLKGIAPGAPMHSCAVGTNLLPQQHVDMDACITLGATVDDDASEDVRSDMVFSQFGFAGELRHGDFWAFNPSYYHSVSEEWAWSGPQHVVRVLPRAPPAILARAADGESDEGEE